MQKGYFDVTGPLELDLQGLFYRIVVLKNVVILTGKLLRKILFYAQ